MIKHYVYIVAQKEELDYRGQSARHTIVEAKQRSYGPVIGRVTKIYYLSVSTLVVGPDCICSRLYPLQFPGGLTSGRQPVVKIVTESLSQHDENMLYRSLSGIRVGKRKI
jgi:hypothetical protein